MSLDTLLEAAKYLEYRSQVKARGEEPHDYYTFSKLSTINSDASNVSSQPSHSHQRHSPSSANTVEEPRERRRTVSSTSRDSLLSQDHIGSGTREVHNKLEKNRRAHLKECFDSLKKQLPNMDERKTSNLSILRGAIRYIQGLKRKERDHEHDLERLARDKIAFQQQLAALKRDLSTHYDHIDVNAIAAAEDNETTTTASECGAGSDFEDDFHNDVSSTSNQNSRVASDDTSSLSSSTAVGTSSRSVTTTASTTPTLSTFPKQTAVNAVFPLGLKGAVVKNNSLFASEVLANKTSSRTAALETVHPSTTSEGMNSHTSSRVISTNSLQGMANILTAPHTVQVITPSSGIKLLTNSIAPSSSANARQQGQIHVLTPSSMSYMAASSITGSGLKSDQSSETVRSKPQASPIALVSSQAFVGISQAVTNPKPVIINQSSNFSEVMASGSTTQLMMKPFGASMALAVKNSNIATDITSTNSPSVLNSGLHVTKMVQQPLSAAQNASNLISAEGNNLRQVTATRAHSISSSACNILTHGSNMAQLVTQSPISVPANQIVASGVTPLVGSVSVVSHTGALHHHQILAQSPSLGKVLATPLLKSINQPIPIIQPQLFQTAGSNQHIVKPVVVVSMPNIIHPNNIAPLTQRPIISANEHSENSYTSAQSIQK